jgi:hypothetical protein
MQTKLGITERAVNLRRAKARRAVGMPDDIALYVVAQQADVPIHKWVKDSTTLAQVATFEEKLAAKQGARRPTTTTQPTRARKTAGRSPEFGLEGITVPAGVLSERHFRDAELMAKNVYPLLYAFENSAREFIDGHLTAVYGSNWWDDPKLVGRDARRAVEIARKAATDDRTHSARNARSIYHTTFGDLVSIVESENGRKVFKRPLFPRPSWFTELVKSSEHSRNIVAHMNPLKQQDIRRLRVDFEDWLNQIKGHLPPSVPT